MIRRSLPCPRATDRIQRRGSSLLAGVLLLATLTLVILVTMRDRAGALARESAGILAGENARQTAVNLLYSTREQLRGALLDPAHPAYRKLRGEILEALRGRRSLDVTRHLDIDDSYSALSWRRRRNGRLEPIGQPHSRLSCTLEGWSSLPVAGPVSPDEAVARLVMHVTTTNSLAAIETSCSLETTHELRVQPVTVPLPFGDKGLYVPDLSRLTDPSRANAARSRILGLRTDLDRSLASVELPPDPDRRETLEAIRTGLSGSIADRLPSLPEEPSAVFGPFGGESVNLESLDLASGLESDLRMMETLVSEVNRSGDVTQRADKVQHIVAILNRAIHRIWLFHRFFRVIPRTGEEFASRIAPHEPVLALQAQESRGMIRLDTGEDRWKRWSSGQEALVGSIVVESREPLRLEGALSGRCLLNLRAPAIELRAVAPRLPGDHLIVAIERGEIRVHGTVEASLILSGSARLVMEPAAVVVGGIYLCGEAGITSLAGKIQPTAAGRNPRDFTYGKAERGLYAMDFSPEPVRQTRDRRVEGGKV